MRREKLIFDGEQTIVADNINGYLIDAPNIAVERRNYPLCAIPIMMKGSIPVDGGNLIIELKDYDDFISQEPRAQKFIRQYVGAEEFLNGKDRYCLWLVDATKEEIQSMPLVAKRVEAVRQFRLSSKRKETRKDAATPSLFSEIRQPTTDYITVPRVSSERRKYIPMDFMTPDVIVSDAVSIIPRAQLYHFAILESSVHMIWTGVVCGRLKSDYRYSGQIVYNNFPWMKLTIEQCFRLTAQAQLILDVRGDYEEMTLAEMYNPESMPEDLRAVHEENDRFVRALYGFDDAMTDLEIITALLEMYQRLADHSTAPRA